MKYHRKRVQHITYKRLINPIVYTDLKVARIIMIKDVFYYQIAAWEQRKLRDLIIEYKETVDADCTLPILTSSKTEGVVLQEDHFGSKQRHDITGYNILPRGYCTYRNRSDGVDFTFNINK